MTKVEFAVELLITGMARRASRTSEHPDPNADEALDASLRAMHDLVLAKLGVDPALERLLTEASQSGEVRRRTQARLLLSLEDAVEEDGEFAQKLETAIRDCEAASGHPEYGVSDHGGVTNQISGNVNGRVVQARDISGGVSF